MNATTPPPAASGSRSGHFRWVICGLLLLAAVINYIDRQVIGILKPTLVEAFGWSDERVYASIVFCFQLAYALGFCFAGRLMDAVGVRLGLAVSVALWSVAAMAHGLAGWVPEGWRLPVLNLDASGGLMMLTLSGAAVGLALLSLVPLPLPLPLPSAHRASARPRPPPQE